MAEAANEWRKLGAHAVPAKARDAGIAQYARVTIQVSLLLRRLRRRDEGEGRGLRAPRLSCRRTPPRGLQGPLEPPC